MGAVQKIAQTFLENWKTALVIGVVFLCLYLVKRYSNMKKAVKRAEQAERLRDVDVVVDAIPDADLTSDINSYLSDKLGK